MEPLSFVVQRRRDSLPDIWLSCKTPASGYILAIRFSRRCGALTRALQRDYPPGDSSKRRGPTYRFFLVRRLFLRVGGNEKLADVRSAGSIGATLVVVLTLTLPVGVSVVFVRMRMGSFRVRFLRRVESLAAAKRLQNAKVSVVDGALIGSASRRKEE